MLRLCLAPLRKRQLNRPRDPWWPDDPPLCGRLAGHTGQHLSQDVMAQARQRVRDWQYARKRERQ
jgi:hypothetical protein